MKAERKGFALCALAACLLGISPVFSRRMTLSGMDASSVVCLTHALTAAACAAAWRVDRRIARMIPDTEQIAGMLTAGALGMGSTTFLLAVAYQYIPTGTATVIHFLYPSAVSACAAVRRHRMEWRNVPAMTVSVLGMAVLTGAAPEGDWRGVAAALTSTLTYTLYLTANQWASYSKLPGRVKMTFLAGGSAVFFCWISLCAGGVTPPRNTQAWSGLAGMFACACIAHTCLTKGIEYLGAEQAAFTTLLEPVASVAAGMIAYGERTTPRGWAGVLLVLSAIALRATADRSLNRTRLSKISSAHREKCETSFRGGQGPEQEGTAAK